MQSRNCKIKKFIIPGFFGYSSKLTALDFPIDYQKADNLKLMGTW